MAAMATGGAMEEPTKHTNNSRREPGRRYISHNPQRPVTVEARPHRTAHSTQSRPAQPVDITVPKAVTPKVREVSRVKPAMTRTKRSMVLRRQMVERAKEQKVKVKKKRSLHALWYLFAAAIICAFAVVIWSFREALPFDIELFKSQPQVVNSVEPKVNESSTLEEAPISAAEIASNMVAADAPKTLRISSITVTARIRQVGTTLSGEPIAPKSIYDVGWYEGSSRPGNDGAVLLNGHLAGPTKAGVFSDIQVLQVGAEIIIERGDGQEITYVVERLQEYTGGQIDMSAAISSIDLSKKGLNLVTTLNKFSGTEKRIIVFAVQQDKN
jgi:sortase (surface protein transpeptidase)